MSLLMSYIILWFVATDRVCHDFYLHVFELTTTRKKSDLSASEALFTQLYDCSEKAQQLLLWTYLVQHLIFACRYSSLYHVILKFMNAGFSILGVTNICSIRPEDTLFFCYHCAKLCFVCVLRRK
jgi:hypothetical protein